MSKRKIRNWLIRKLGGYTFDELNPVFKYEKNQIINIKGSMTIQHEMISSEKEANEYLERIICSNIANEIYNNHCYKIKSGYNDMMNCDIICYQIRVVKEDCYE